MRRPKGVVNVEVTERRKFPSEVRIVLLFTRVKAHVLEQQYVAVGHLGDGLARDRTDAVGGKSYRYAKALRERRRNRA